MATTTNFGWDTPDDTDLVKDGAAAIRTLGSAIDTSLVDLKGGTTGQVLSKASNTDMDFTWSDADPLKILDAKGDLISATAADTPARLAVGTDGQYLQADSSTATGLKWSGISAGAYTSIASGSLSGTSLSLTSISASYKDLRLVLRDVSTDNNAYLGMRLNNDTGANYWSAGVLSQTGAALAGSAIDDQILLSRGPSSVPLSAASADNIFVVDLTDYQSASWKTGFIQSFFTTSTGNCVFFAGTGWKDTAAIDRIDIILNSTHQFDGGTYILYGVN